MTLNTSTPSPEAVVQNQMPPRQGSGGLRDLAGSAGRAPTIIATNVPLFWGAGRLLFVEHPRHSVLHVLFNLYENPVIEVLSPPFCSLSSGTTYLPWLPNANVLSISRTCESHSLLLGQSRSLKYEIVGHLCEGACFHFLGAGRVSVQSILLPLNLISITS